MKRPRSRALGAKEVKHILKTMQHSPDFELSRITLSDAFNLADRGVLLVFAEGNGRVYESKNELVAMLEELQQKARRGPVSPCQDLPQGPAFPDLVPHLIRGLPAHLKIEAAQLDGTPESLDKIDLAIRRMRYGRMLTPDIFAALTAYVGEVIRNETKGRWEMRRASDLEKTWEPWIVDPDGRSYAPFKIYKELLEYGRSASLRVFVEWELGSGA